MCGIVGILYKSGSRQAGQKEILPLLACIRHRGPDDEGIYVDGNVALGHTRLSILDLSDAGHQPMHSEDGRLSLVYNGEVYNFEELRGELIGAGYRFQSRSDTEAVLHWFHRFGKAGVDRFRGMFAMALWDRERRVLTLVRDRFGIKPLYLYEDENKFIFASEIQAILADPTVDASLDPLAISDFLTYRYVPAPRTGYRRIRKVPPATILELDASGVRNEATYYTPNFKPSAERWSWAETEERVYEELKRSVRYRLISDVPVGIFLSGGLDSSALVAVAADLGHHPIKTFSIAGAGSDRNDERPFARLVAERYGTEHHEVVFEPTDLVSVLEQVVVRHGEPLSDMPAVPMLLLSEMAKRHVSVALTGEGSDEILGGYSFEKDRWAQAYFDYVAGRLGPAGRRRLQEWRPGSYLGQDASGYLAARLPNMIKSFNQGGVAKTDLLEPGFVPAGHDSLDLLRRAYAENAGLPYLNRILQVYSRHWLTDDLLTRSDRMSMAHALELRVPFLDHVFVDLIGSLPVSRKIGRWRGRPANRLVLRRIMADRLPEEVLTRKKAGFTLPLQEWARKDLRDFIRDQFATAPHPLRPEGCLKLLAAYEKPGGHYHREIWQTLMLILWLRSNERRPSVPGSHIGTVAMPGGDGAACA